MKGSGFKDKSKLEVRVEGLRLSVYGLGFRV